MKKVNIIFLLISAAFLMFSCKNKTTTNVAWTTDALAMPAQLDRNRLPEPNSEGARLVDRYCSQCHGIPSPASHDASDWVPVFRRMILLMEKSEANGSRERRNGWNDGQGNAHGDDGIGSAIRQRTGRDATLSAGKCASINNKRKTSRTWGRCCDSLCQNMFALPCPAFTRPAYGGSMAGSCGTHARTDEEYATKGYHR